MHHACTLFVVLLHMAACVHMSVPLMQEDSVAEDCVLQIWTVFGGAIIASEMTRPPRANRHRTIDYHVSAMCVCAVCNVALSRLTSPSFGYCFFLHSVCSIAISIVLDPGCAYMTRVLGGFVIPAAVFGVLLFPRRLEISTLAFFVEQRSKPFPDTSFEAAHLWGIVAASAIRAGVSSTRFILARL